VSPYQEANHEAGRQEKEKREMMNYRRSLVAGAAALLLVGAFVVAQVGLAPTVARAQGEIQSTITVIGEGTVSIEPDMVQATIGVEIVRPTVKEASAEADVVMNAVFQALQEQGVAEKDMQTSSFSVWTDQSYTPDGSLGEVAYRVSNQVNVTIRDLDKVGDILDAAMAVGANSIYGVSFSLSDPEEVESEARAKAVDNARAKAQELAQLTDLQLGTVVSVSEVIGTGGYYAGGVREAALQGFGGGAPIMSGELELTLQLQIVFGTVQ
jgi:uncharacterized protein YggE